MSASFFLFSYSKVVYQIMLTFDSEEVISHSLIDGKNLVVMYSVLILVP